MLIVTSFRSVFHVIETPELEVIANAYLKIFPDSFSTAN